MKKENVFIRGWRYTKKAYLTLAKHRYTTIAGTLVFFLIMSLTPFVFWLTLLFGSAQVDYTALGLFEWAGDLLKLIQTNAEQATAGVSVLFLATTLWSSTGFFYHLRRSGEIIYEYRREKKGWKVRLSAVLLTFGVIAAFAVAGSVFVAVDYLTDRISPWLAYPLRYILGFAFAFLCAWMLNGYVCPYRVNPSDTVLGSLFTALAWALASALFSVYMIFANPERLYGALSLVIVFLLWLYWLMICFTAGVVYNRYRVARREHKKL